MQQEKNNVTKRPMTSDRHSFCMQNTDTQNTEERRI